MDRLFGLYAAFLTETRTLKAALVYAALLALALLFTAARSTARARLPLLTACAGSLAAEVWVGAQRGGQLADPQTQEMLIWRIRSCLALSSIALLAFCAMSYRQGGGGQDTPP